MADKATQKNQAKLKREQAQAAAAAAARRNKQLQILGGVVFAAIAAVIIVVLVSSSTTKKKAGDDGIGKGGALQGVTETKNLLAGIPQSGYTLGDPKAPITILEFLDVQCPFCQRHELDEQPTVIKQLVKTGKAALKMQPVALPQMGEDSEAGRVVLTRLAAENHAWNFANLFYFNQGEEATGYVTDAFLSKLAVAAGGKATDNARTGDATIKAKLAAVDKLQTDLNVTGTPTFAIGLTGKPETTYKQVTLSGTQNATDIIDAVTALEKSAKVG